MAVKGRLEGVITTQALSRIPQGEWAEHIVSEVMSPDLREVRIAADADALGKMHRTGASRLPVTDGDRLIAIVSLKDLLGFLNLKLELEGRDDIPPQNGDSGNGRAGSGDFAPLTGMQGLSTKHGPRADLTSPGTVFAFSLINMANRGLASE